MFTFLLVLQILVSISIITLVMLQQGKGADMGAAFGSGASGTMFGSRGSGSFFTKATGILAAVFFINCLLIASPLVRKSASNPGSVVEQIEQQAAGQQEAAEAEKIPEAPEKLEAEPRDQPEDLPIPAGPAASADAAQPETPATPGGAEDLPE